MSLGIPVEEFKKIDEKLHALDMKDCGFNPYPMFIRLSKKIVDEKQAVLIYAITDSANVQKYFGVMTTLTPEGEPDLDACAVDNMIKLELFKLKRTIC